MARPIRIQYAGAVYHVMARGNQGREVFGDNQVRKTFLASLEEACAKTGWRIYAWVMMSNHYLRLDLRTRETLESIEVPQSPSGLALSADETRLLDLRLTLGFCLGAVGTPNQPHVVAAWPRSWQQHRLTLSRRPPSNSHRLPNLVNSSKPKALHAFALGVCTERALRLAFRRSSATLLAVYDAKI